MSETGVGRCPSTLQVHGLVSSALCLDLHRRYEEFMATSFALDPAYRRVEVHEFLEMDFQGAKAELVDGLIFMMAGGSERHAMIAANVLSYLRVKLRGSGCRTYGSDLAARTGERSIRFPDVSVYCGALSDEQRRSKLIGYPQVLVEVLSPSTRSLDETEKLAEYCALKGMRDVLLIDPEAERVRIVSRASAGARSGDWLSPGSDAELPSLGLTIPHAEIFALD